TAELTKARPIILLDNLPERRSLDSSALAAVVTSDPWTDHVLGESRMISLPNRALWLITANNPSLSDELARRASSTGRTAGGAGGGAASGRGTGGGAGAARSVPGAPDRGLMYLSPT
ncbi:MAG: hypothetical protein QME77_02735, partial [bacterium]|nr:hypothetical protein [bacterium]